MFSTLHPPPLAPGGLGAGTWCPLSGQQWSIPLSPPATGQPPASPPPQLWRSCSISRLGGRASQPPPLHRRPPHLHPLSRCLHPLLHPWTDGSRQDPSPPGRPQLSASGHPGVQFLPSGCSGSRGGDPLSMGAVWCGHPPSQLYAPGPEGQGCCSSVPRRLSSIPPSWISGGPLAPPGVSWHLPGPGPAISRIGAKLPLLLFPSVTPAPPLWALHPPAYSSPLQKSLWLQLSVLSPFPPLSSSMSRGTMLGKHTLRHLAGWPSKNSKLHLSGLLEHTIEHRDWKFRY